MSELREVQVRDGVRVWGFEGDGPAASYGANCVAVVADAGVVLIDTLLSPTHARRVEAALRQKTDRPVRLVVLTHHHADHTWGAVHFVRQGALVVAHRACRERMAADHPGQLAARRGQAEAAELLSEVVLVLPSLTFDQGIGVHLGVEVEVWHPGHGHTPGDAFVYLPEAGVAVCGDLVFHRYHFNYQDADPAGVRRGLEALRSLDAEVFVPGHGLPGGPELLQAQAAYHDAVEEVVRRFFLTLWNTYVFF
ncbi:MAG: MBL fold metallo-hydrolase, partial [bacterium]